MHKHSGNFSYRLMSISRLCLIVTYICKVVYSCFWDGYGRTQWDVIVCIGYRTILEEMVPEFGRAGEDDRKAKGIQTL